MSTNPVEVSEIISSLNRKNTLDIDCVSTVLIKAVSTEISEPLSHIFNLSFSTGQIPINLKTSRTCPVFKSDCPENLTNYRPISCLPALSKVIEKIVFKQLYNYLSINNILYKNQFGFQPGKSTLHPLVHILNYIADAFNNNEIAVGVFLDFRKAFDLVDHKVLLTKENRN